MTGPKTPDPVDVHVGTRLRAARNLSGLSQDVVAQSVGLTFQQVQKYEKGTNRISASRLVQFAMLLGQPVEWFFEGAPGYRGATGTDVSADFFSRPYARDLANYYVAIAHNVDRDLVRRVAHALAGRNGQAADHQS